MSYACGGLTPDLGLGHIQPHSHITSRTCPNTSTSSSTRCNMADPPLVMLTGYPQGVFGSPAHAPAENPSRGHGAGCTICKIYYINFFFFQTNKEIKSNQIEFKIEHCRGFGMPAYPQCTPMSSLTLPNVKITYYFRGLGMPTYPRCTL